MIFEIVLKVSRIEMVKMEMFCTFFTFKAGQNCSSERALAWLTGKQTWRVICSEPHGWPLRGWGSRPGSCSPPSPAGRVLPGTHLRQPICSVTCQHHAHPTKQVFGKPLFLESLFSSHGSRRNSCLCPSSSWENSLDCCHRMQEEKWIQWTGVLILSSFKLLF